MLSRTFAVSDVVQFAQLTGDTNPIHLDAELARRTRFGQPIVHGVLAAGLISAVIGTKLPGPGTIYLSQSLNFEAPVMIGDTITARVTVVRLRRDKPIATLETVCTNQNGRTVLRGKAVVLVEGGD
ncbi:MAG: MaoC family dehydratase [candidate division WOR-3 bacterium]